MKRILVSALLLALLFSLAGCRGSYRRLDVPKELHIDAKALSEDADNLMPVDDDTPLLAAIPEEGLYIYYTDPTIQSGVLVKFDGILQFFPWRFTPQIAEPDVYVADYNGDGKKDVAFTFLSESGATAGCENLHVLLRGERGFEDCYYTAEKAAIECGNHLLAYPGDGEKVTVYLDGKPTELQTSRQERFLGLYLKRKVSLTLGEQITVRIDPGLEFDSENSPVYSVFTYTAQIEYADGKLTQTHPSISKN